MSAISVIKELCVGCEVCLSSCPFGALSMDAEIATVDIQTCNLCGACVDVCPADAIKISVQRKSRVNLDAYKGVWVFAEQVEGKISSVVFELMGAGRKLAESRQSELCAVLIGHDVRNQVEELFMRGADKVYHVEHPNFYYYLDEPYANIFARLVKEHQPEIVLAGATTIGRALIPRVATLLGTGLTADCTGLEIDSETGNLLQTRPAFGGNIMARIVCENHRPQMATVRPKVMAEAPINLEKKPGEIISVKVSDEQVFSKTKVIERKKSDQNVVNIADAEIIISGGGGLKRPEDFDLLHELASQLNGCVAASRVVVEKGWIDYSRQVGQTGKTVSPKVYIAVGISGAVQHMVGMSSADIVIAINNDPDAEIFRSADYGLVGDLYEIVPELTKRLQQRCSG